jgi:hypothetical protein
MQATCVNTEKLNQLYAQIETAAITFRSFADTVRLNYSQDEEMLKDLEIVSQDVDSLIDAQKIDQQEPIDIVEKPMGGRFILVNTKDGKLYQHIMAHPFSSINATIVTKNKE